MSSIHKSVRIIIPLYKTEITPEEHTSLECCFRLYGQSRPITFIKPESLDLTELHRRYPEADIETFPDHYFKGLEGYNRLMLSAEFYERFLDTEYLFIYQTDAYLFSDDLKEWCDKGYDYIGAPWIPKKKYRKLYYRVFIKLRTGWCHLFKRSDPAILYYKVGNGGLSLRKTDSHYKVASAENDPVLEAYRRKCADGNFNEDIFWSVEVNAKQKRFTYPDYREALGFSFDKSPEEVFEMNNRKLPMGCHGWSKPQMLPFWKPFIPQKSRTNEKI